MSKGDFDFPISTISGSATGNVFKTLKGNRVEPPYYLKTLFSIGFSLMGQPMRWWEHLRYDREVENFKIEQPPIFILGHWRSGTTYLHNLLCEDPSAGFVSTYQTVFPELVLGGQWLFKRFMTKNLPEKRASDNMAIATDSPQEDEFAIANTHQYSFYNFWIFPTRTKEYYEKYVEFNGVNEEIRNFWKKKYFRLIKKALIYTKGKRFISKNPPHTGRIKLLLEMFPDAKFVYIHRNPYKVFISTKKLLNTSMPPLQLQTISPEDLEENIFWVYERIIKRYLSERALVPKGNLVEVRFEDLEENALETLESIYSQLSLPDFKKVKPGMERHILSQEGYKKNKYRMSSTLAEKISMRWKFTINEWNYSMPSNLELVN